MEHHEAKPINTVKFLTPGVFILILIALNGIVFIAGRFLFGIGAVTNLDNMYPWGIWIGIDVAAGVALAAGGFISAAIGHIMHREHYHVIVRPALLTAMLGYTFVAFGVFIDIGRWYYIWHPLVMWNPNSALFEVGICVMIYLTVLYIEFLPIVTERFMNKVNLPGILRIFNNILNKILIALDKGLSKTMFVFIIAGVVLSSLHQSSLGTLMVIAGDKMHPLWQTPILPLLFLISAVGVGIPMIIFESLIASKSFKLKPEMPVLSRLATYVGPILGVYLSFKLGDLVIREAFVYLVEFNVQTVMFLIEMIIGLVVPLVMFLNKKVLASPAYLLLASGLVVFGVLLNRINNFVVAYHPPYADYAYFPSYGEISVTLGAAALLILLYRAAVMIFPVITPEEETAPKSI
ncbi:MAG: Ni/Fe-hydrogenase cytochrome b subunit [Candidatus Kapabacteria bacterium]|nr:Ni/Fe-hydrogenase cytochrome b subunit [Ignavibacteriota bacterium]MCW5884246.1 Ni/Fe-hydrogenase cytochrome b subunit [Candidatus Kapabacteria bacterium]